MMQDANHSQPLTRDRDISTQIAQACAYRPKDIGTMFVRKSHPSFVAIERADGKYVQDARR